MGLILSAQPAPRLPCRAVPMASAPRAIKNKPPNCILTEFAEAGMKFSLTFWIADPDGLDNVKSDVMLALWDAFKREGIRVPYPVREIRVRGGALPVGQVVEVSGQKQVFLEPPAPQPRLAAARSNH
jgi:small-conductance mechanosensitive channel